MRGARYETYLCSRDRYYLPRLRHKTNPPGLSVVPGMWVEQVQMRLIIPGKPPSVNHMYHHLKNSKRGSMLVLKAEGQEWFDRARVLAGVWKSKTGWVIPPPKQKVVINVWYYFENDLRPDPSNCLKIILDALQGVIYFNDKHVLAREQNYSFDKEHPRIELQFEVLKGA